MIDVVENNFVEPNGFPRVAEHKRGLMKGQIPWSTIVSQVLIFGQFYLTVKEVTLKIAI
jgi:hypothetical protein